MENLLLCKRSRYWWNLKSRFDRVFMGLRSPAMYFGKPVQCADELSHR